MEKTVKVGDIFTVERDVCASIGTDYLLALMEGGIALVETYLLQDESSQLDGSSSKKVFMFKCIRPGEAAFQLALFHASDPSHILYEPVCPIEVQADEDLINQDDVNCGGWGDFRELNDEDRELFNRVIGRRIIGVGYKPLQVAPQVVSGMNYRFYCEAISATNPPERYYVQITIYVPLSGHSEAYVTNIIRVLEKK